MVKKERDGKLIDVLRWKAKFSRLKTIVSRVTRLKKNFVVISLNQELLEKSSDNTFRNQIGGKIYYLDVMN